MNYITDVTEYDLIDHPIYGEGTYIIDDNVDGISDNLFKYNKTIVTLIITKNIFINEETFKECNIENIIFDINYFNMYGQKFNFSKSNNLKKVVFPKNISNFNYNEIFLECFKDCINLEEVELPININRINSKMFENCESLQSIKLNNNLTEIGEEAFKNCKSLYNVEFGNYDYEIILNIKKSAFFGCESLETITLPIINHSTLNIYDEVFKNCKKLKIINNFSEEYIRSSKFYRLFENCESLETITMPININSMEKTFINCKSLKNIIFKGGNISFGINTFKGCSSLKNFTFPNISDNYIITGLFENCISLESITIPKKVKIIYKNAFRNCSNLKNIIFEEDSLLTDLKNECFANCVSLESINLPPNLINCEKDIFKNCINLKNINNIPNNIEKILGFNGCNSLTNIIFNENTKILGEYAFANCNGLKNLDLSNSNIEILSSYCFENCKNLESIILPPTLYLIEKGCFRNCDNLKNIILYNNINEISDNCFENCDNLINIKIPNTIKILGNSAFENCKKLEKVEFNENNENPVIIKSKCFKDCINLKYFIFPENLNLIESNAFENCTKLETINFSNNIETIENYSFNGCINLININIPNKYIDIGDNVFDFTFNLDEEYDIILNSNDIELKLEKNENGYFDSRNRYIEDFKYSNKKGFETLEIEGNYNLTIGKGSFENCNDIKTIIIKTNSINIKEKAFFNCKNLERVIITYNNEYSYSYGLNLIIDDEAFAFCNNLKSIDFPDIIYNGVYITPKIFIKRIGCRAFYDCTNLESFIMNYYNETSNYLIYNYNSLGCISTEAFSGCINLENIKFPILRNFITNEYSSILYDSGYTNYYTFGRKIFNNCKKLISPIKNYKILEMYYTTSEYDGINEKCFYNIDNYGVSVANYDKCLKLFRCKDKFFKFNEWSEEIDELELFKKGYHYSKKIYDSLNSYPLIKNSNINSRNSQKKISDHNDFINTLKSLNFYKYENENNPVTYFVNELEELYEKRKNNLNENDGMEIYSIYLLCEIETGQNIIEDENSSICVTNKIKITRIFNYKEVSKLINGEDV